ncbi:FlgO family outer membrane protein [Shewanella sp. UCD-KL21]|uniref:FlgO family outer membrane protein n=1 Tax=Shewanella sp. UCD-KL21 TaxID=1917164 RepID=UPI0009704185|nr:FlgO family outer membrane protein [Shewanella sp. UCD-KL21]
MRRIGLLPIMMLMTACAGSQPTEYDDLSYVNEGYEMNFWYESEPKTDHVIRYDIQQSGIAPKAGVNRLAEKIVNELVLQNDSLRADQPLLITTPVMVDDYGQTNLLGQQLQQGMLTAFHANEFNLVDMNVASSLRATAEGEFILSRDWKQLATDLAVSHVVVATMGTTSEGVVVNARIVNTSNNRVVSAVQTFVKTHSLPGYLTPANKVISKDGILYRNEHGAMASVTILGDNQ